MTPLLTISAKELADEVRFFLSEGRSVKIEFRKKDGTQRNALVTSNLMYIPPHQHPKYVRSVPAGYIVMFDRDKMDWISCHESQVTGVMPLPR
jgi:hypothetical protein